MASLIEGIAQATQGLLHWQQSAYMCSAPSQAYFYVLVGGSALIAAAGVFLWQRVIKPKSAPRLAAA